MNSVTRCQICLEINLWRLTRCRLFRWFKVKCMHRVIARRKLGRTIQAIRQSNQLVMLANLLKRFTLNLISQRCPRCSKIYLAKLTKVRMAVARPQFKTLQTWLTLMRRALNWPLLLGRAALLLKNHCLNLLEIRESRFDLFKGRSRWSRTVSAGSASCNWW